MTCEGGFHRPTGIIWEDLGDKLDEVPILQDCGPEDSVRPSTMPASKGIGTRSVGIFGCGGIAVLFGGRGWRWQTPVGCGPFCDPAGIRAPRGGYAIFALDYHGVRPECPSWLLRGWVYSAKGKGRVLRAVQAMSNIASATRSRAGGTWEWRGTERGSVRPLHRGHSVPWARWRPASLPKRVWGLPRHSAIVGGVPFARGGSAHDRSGSGVTQVRRVIVWVVGEGSSRGRVTLIPGKLGWVVESWPSPVVPPWPNR